MIRLSFGESDFELRGAVEQVGRPRWQKETEDWQRQGSRDKMSKSSYNEWGKETRVVVALVATGCPISSPTPNQVHFEDHTPCPIIHPFHPKPATEASVFLNQII